ncbi:MAG: hypothetical protein J6K42_05150 [Clostridia bacterium]|nr:hypothetical protein [Clostridia bacterium]
MENIRNSLPVSVDNMLIEKPSYVIDASTTSAEDFSNKIMSISGNKIITKLTFHELRPLRFKGGQDEKNVNFIFNEIAKNSNNDWILVDYDNLSSADNDKTLLDFCIKYGFSLITSDSEFTLRARFYGVDVQYWKAPKVKNSYFSKFCTLKYASFEQSKLFIYPNYSKGKVYLNNKLIKTKTELNVGDIVTLETMCKKRSSFKIIKAISNIENCIRVKNP